MEATVASSNAARVVALRSACVRRCFWLDPIVIAEGDDSRGGFLAPSPASHQGYGYPTDPPHHWPLRPPTVIVGDLLQCARRQAGSPCSTPRPPPRRCTGRGIP